MANATLTRNTNTTVNNWVADREPAQQDQANISPVSEQEQVEAMLTALERLEQSPGVRALSRYLGAREDRLNGQGGRGNCHHQAFVPLSAQKTGEADALKLGDIGWLHLDRNGIRLVELQKVKCSLAWGGAKRPVQVALREAPVGKFLQTLAGHRDSRAVLATMDLAQIERQIQLALNEVKRPGQQGVIQVSADGVGTFSL